MTSACVPALVHGLFDNAALFPPGNAAMPDAVAAHLRRREGWSGATVGPFVCPAGRVGELAAEMPADAAPVRVSLTVPDGPAAVAAALDAARALPQLRVVVVEVPLGAYAPATVAGDLAGVDGYVEVPVADVTTDLVEAVGCAGLRLKLRTGGAEAAAFPGVVELAYALQRCVAAGVPVKCTAGLHHAVRQQDPGSGIVHHGFLNVVLAVHAARAGATTEVVRSALSARDRTAVAAQVRDLDTEQVAGVRAAFRSFGTCSVDEPLNGLVTTGLVTT